MALSWEQTKSLMRLQAVSQELVVAARRAADQRSSQRSAAAGHRVDALIEQIRDVLAQAETPDLLGEFDRVLQGAPGGSTAVEAKAVAVFGWLRGAVEAEAFEMRARTEADAYAAERVRSERPIGFSQPPDDSEAVQ